MSTKLKLPFICLLSVTLLFAPASSLQVTNAENDDFEPTVIAEHDFENENLHNWEPREEAGDVFVTDEEAYSGDSSLKITERSADEHMPKVELTPYMERGADYEIEIYLRLGDSAGSTPMNLTMLEQIGQSEEEIDISDNYEVTDSDWAKLEGEFEFHPSANGAFLNVNADENTTADYYVDAVKITQTTPGQGGDPMPEQKLVTGFEDQTTQGWGARLEGERVSVTSEDSYDGDYSLLTEERTENISSPTIGLTDFIMEGQKYQVSVWVKLAPDEDPEDLLLTVQHSYNKESHSEPVTETSEVTDEEWVKLSGDYVLEDSADEVRFSVESKSGTSSFYLDELSIETTPPSPIQEDIPSLKTFYEDHFEIGAAIEPYQLTGRHGEMLNKHYNSLVAENIMKPEVIEPEEGEFNFTAADEMFDFAEEQDMDMRYHTLVWHNQVGDWFFLDEDGNEMVEETDPQKQKENKELLIDRMKTHLTEVVTRYQGQVDSWDVVNEVIDPDSDDPDGMRESEWYQIAGKDFIAEAFKLVNELDPDAKLYINDYNTHEPEKRDYLYDLVVELLDEGVPINGVGHQTHINVEYPPVELVSESIEMFADLGLDNQITELDLAIYPYGEDIAYETFEDIPEEIIETQTERYEELFDELLRLSDDISNVTFWGIGDDHTWLHNDPIPRKDAPFLFDEELQAKPAYWALIDTVGDIMDDVDRFEKDGEFSHDEAPRRLQLHLTAVEQFESQEEAEKVVNHMEGFHALLDHQRVQEYLSEDAYTQLYEQSEDLMQAWKH